MDNLFSKTNVKTALFALAAVALVTRLSPDARAFLLNNDGDYFTN